MLVDAHTHIFPPAFVERRADLCLHDAGFAALYGDPRAKLAAAPELLAAMERNGTDYAVALGFAWGNQELCRRHNDALLEAAAESGGRIIPFCTVNPADNPDTVAREIERCAAAGARGIGELRPSTLGYDLDGAAGQTLAAQARALDLILLFHASEPVGHLYPGKEGGELGSLYRFVATYPDIRVVLAHWGGGLPLYAYMPEVQRALANTWFDTAATTLLYDPGIYRAAIEAVGAERILFGSDFPLLGPLRQRRALLAVPLTEREHMRILGDNAAGIFGL